MLDHWVFGLVSCTYNISLTALINKAWVSRAWSPTKFGFTPFKAFPIQKFKKLVPLDSPGNCLIRVAEKRALHLCSRITRQLSTSTSTEYPLSLRISLAVGSNTILLWNRLGRLSITFIYVEVGEIPHPAEFEPMLEDGI